MIFTGQNLYMNTWDIKDESSLRRIKDIREDSLFSKLGKRVVDSIKSLVGKTGDFLKEIFYKISLIHRGSLSLSDAIYNIELGDYSSLGKNYTGNIVRMVSEDEFRIAKKGLEAFTAIYGKLKDRRLGSLIDRFNPNFQQIRFSTQSEEDLETQLGAEIWLKLTENERSQLIRQAEEIGISPQELTFTTLFALFSEREYLLYKAINKSISRRLTYETFIEEAEKEMGDFDPTERINTILAQHYEVENMEQKVEELFLNGIEPREDERTLRELREDLIKENRRVRELLDSYGVEVHGTVQNVYADIQTQISARRDLSVEERRELIENLSQAMSRIEELKQELYSINNDYVRDELIHYAERKAEDENIPPGELQKYINGILFQEVTLGGYRGELIFAINAFVRWVFDYRFSDGITLQERINESMEQEVVKRAVKVALEIIFTR